MRKKNYSRPNRNYSRPNITRKNKEIQRDQDHHPIQQPTIPIKKPSIKEKTDMGEQIGVKKTRITLEERQAYVEEFFGVKNPLKKSPDHEVVLNKILESLTEKSARARELVKPPDPREQLNSLKTERKRIETRIKQLETDVNNKNRQKNGSESSDIINSDNKNQEFKNDNEKSKGKSLAIGIGDSVSQQPSREKSEKIAENIAENLPDLKTDLLTKEITRMCNVLISECTKQRGEGGSFYQHVKNAEKTRKISAKFRDYLYEFRNTLKKINSPAMSRAIIAGFDTTADSVGTPGSDMKPIVGKNNPRHLVTYKIPKGEKGVFENGKRTIEVEEIWGSGQKSQLVFDKLTKEWIEDLTTIEMGRDRRTGKIRPLHSGEILDNDTGNILPDPVISTQVKNHQGKMVIEGKRVTVWAPNPKIGVGRELAHTSDRNPRALSRHFLKNSGVNRIESVRLFSLEDHRMLARDQKKVRQKAWELFIKEKNLTGKILDLDVCFQKARKDRKLAPRFNNDNTYPPMDYEENWINDMPDDEMPKFNGKPYGNKTFKEIHNLRKQFGVRGATSSVKKYYAGNDPKIEKRFNEYLEDRMQKVEIRGEFKDLTPEQQYVLIKIREIAEYINIYLYHHFFGKMSIDIDSQEKQVNKTDLEIKYGKHSKKFDDLINLLDDFGVSKPDFIFPTKNMDFSIENRLKLSEEFLQKNPYPFYDNRRVISLSIIKDLNKSTVILKKIRELTEILPQSANVFSQSFYGRKMLINGTLIKGTLNHYRQNFKGFNGILNGNHYNIPPGTKHQTSFELTTQYDEYYKSLLAKTQVARQFNYHVKLLYEYHNEVIQSKSMLRDLKESKYLNNIFNMLESQIAQYRPIENESFQNFKQIYDFSGEPRPHASGRPEAIEQIGILFFRSHDNLNQISKLLKKFKDELINA